MWNFTRQHFQNNFVGFVMLMRLRINRIENHAHIYFYVYIYKIYPKSMQPFNTNKNNPPYISDGQINHISILKRIFFNNLLSSLSGTFSAARPLYSLQRNKTQPKKKNNKTATGDQGIVEYLFIAITPRSTRIQGGSTCLGPIYGLIDMFKNYSYWTVSCAKNY